MTRRRANDLLRLRRLRLAQNRRADRAAIAGAFRVLLYRTAHDIEQAERLAADLATVLEQLITEAAEDE